MTLAATLAGAAPYWHALIFQCGFGASRSVLAGAVRVHRGPGQEGTALCQAKSWQGYYVV